MPNTLDYATPASRVQRGRLWPAMLIALLGCPLISAGVSVFGCQQALGGSMLSYANFVGSASWGAISGGVGGLLVAFVALVLGRYAIGFSIVGSLVVAAASGGLMFILTAISAGC